MALYTRVKEATFAVQKKHYEKANLLLRNPYPACGT